MCKLKLTPFKKLKSSYAAEMLKGKFPSCGIKYTSKHDHGLVLVRHDVTDMEAVKQKAKAANDAMSYIFVIPKDFCRAIGL